MKHVVLIISYSRYEHCDEQEEQLGLLALDIFLEHKTCAKTTDHEAEEPKGPDQVDGVYMLPIPPPYLAKYG